LTQVFKDRPYFIKVNAIQSIDDITRDVMNNLRPVVLATYYEALEEEQFIERLESEKGWTIIDV
jgi:hypothetical protein